MKKTLKILLLLEIGIVFLCTSCGGSDSFVDKEVLVRKKYEDKNFFLKAEKEDFVEKVQKNVSYPIVKKKMITKKSKKKNFKKGSLQILIDSENFYKDKKGRLRLSSVKGSFLSEEEGVCETSYKINKDSFNLDHELKTGLFKFNLLKKEQVSCYFQVNSLNLDGNLYKADSSCLGDFYSWETNSSCLLKAVNASVSPQELILQTVRNLSSFDSYNEPKKFEVEMVLRVD